MFACVRVYKTFTFADTVSINLALAQLSENCDILGDAIILKYFIYKEINNINMYGSQIRHTQNAEVLGIKMLSCSCKIQ